MSCGEFLYCGCDFHNRCAASHRIAGTSVSRPVPVAIQCGSIPLSTRMPAVKFVLESTNMLKAKSAEKTRPRNLSSVFICRSVVEKTHTIEAYTFELGKCYERDVRERTLLVLAKIDTAIHR